MTGIGTFLLFGAVTASLAGASLVWRGTALDRMWTLNPAVIATQVLGGAVNIFMGRIVEGGIGVAIAGALLFYALRADVKSVFQRGGPHTSNVE